MTVSSEAYFNILAWTGVEGSFATGIKIAAEADLKVTHVTTSDGTRTLLTLATHYTVALEGNGIATVTPVAFPAGAGDIEFERVTPSLQPVDFANLGGYSAQVHESLHDAAAMRGAEARGAALRAVLTPLGESQLVLAAAAVRAGLYLKFDGSGNPALGDPAGLDGSSTTSVAIGTGSKDFVTQAGKAFDVGTFVTIASDADPATDWMFGQVTAYAGAALTVDVQSVGGSGTPTDWTIRLAGARGAIGPQGPAGPGTGDMLASVYDPLGAMADAFDMDEMIEGTTNLILLAAERTKIGHLTVTQAVDLDQIETRVNALDAAIVLMGSWHASSGSFPGGGTAQAGESWIVSAGGTVNGVVFVAGDRIIALTDNASTSTYASNWLKADYSDLVSSVAGLVGAITAAALRTQLNVEAGATADQTNAEIEMAYNAQVSVIAQAEAEAGTATTVRRWTALRVAQAIAALAPPGGVAAPTAYNGFGVGTWMLAICDTSSVANGSTTTLIEHVTGAGSLRGGAAPGGTWRNVSGADLGSSESHDIGHFVRTA